MSVHVCAFRVLSTRLAKTAVHHIDMANREGSHICLAYNRERVLLIYARHSPLSLCIDEMLWGHSIGMMAGSGN